VTFHSNKGMADHPRILIAALSAVVLGACQPSAPAPEGAVQVSPAAVGVAPGGQVQFSVRSPWGSDVTWSVGPPSCGAITQSGLFTASLNPSEISSICTVVATLRSDPLKVGLAVVIVDVAPPTNSVAASGQRQTADGVQVESVVLEPVSTVTSRDSSGEIESRSGFYPSGNVSP